MMSDYILLALSNPMPGDDDEYNAWYQDVHLPQVLSLEGMKSAQRYQLKQTMTDGIKHQYLAIYTITSDDISQLLERLQALHGTDDMIISESLDENGAVAAVYERLGERLIS